MRTIFVAVAAATVAAASLGAGQQRPDERARGYRLEDLTWVEAEAIMTAEAVVVVPIAAASRPHGPHMLLDTDAVLANYLTSRVSEATPVLVAPPLTYFHDQTVHEYPGSSALSLPVARNLAVDVVRSISRHGPRRFYAIAATPSAMPALAEAARQLRDEGILFEYADPARHLEAAVRAIQQQRAGDHAGEIETSMMLYVDETRVDMSNAVRHDEPAATPIVLRRRPGGSGLYSPAGVWGDATRATREKGRLLADAMVTGILGDIAVLRSAAVPELTTPGSWVTPPDRRGEPRRGSELSPSGCSAGDERTIRRVGVRYTSAWRNLDALTLAGLWAEFGDMAHPDGSVERTRELILANRTALFQQKEYRSSRHSLQVGRIRCLTGDIAVADGKWDLRDVTDGAGRIRPSMQGLFTLVLRRTDGWLIESFRYTIDPPEPGGPTLLPRPGYPGRGGAR